MSHNNDGDEGEFVSPFSPNQPHEDDGYDDHSETNAHHNTSTAVKQSKKKQQADQNNAAASETTTTTNSSSQPIEDPSSPPLIKKPEWVPDNSSSKCEMCSTDFTLFNRISGLQKVLLWKMGAYEDGEFDRSVIDSLENYPATAIPVSRVQDLMLEPSDLDVQGCTGFRVRIYNPQLEPGQKSTNFPILMWFHTGGLAPENQFPAAALDCYAATCWAVKKSSSFDGDPTRIVVAGDSVGGNLAAAVSLMARDKESPKLCGQVLIYPILDLRRNEEKYFTRTVHQDGFLMPMSYFKWFSGKYCHQNDVDNIYASPLRAAATKIGLSGVPPAHVITAGHDPFCDEGELYVKKLRSANVQVQHTRYTNSPHGFFAIGLDESNEAVMERYYYWRLGDNFGELPWPGNTGKVLESAIIERQGLVHLDLNIIDSSLTDPGDCPVDFIVIAVIDAQHAVTAHTITPQFQQLCITLEHNKILKSLSLRNADSDSPLRLIPAFSEILGKSLANNSSLTKFEAILFVDSFEEPLLTQLAGNK
eukprot:gene15499-18410_t